MSVQSTLALDAQAHALVEFVRASSHELPHSTAIQICQTLTGPDKLAARQLRDLLSAQGIELKHMHTLKALNVLRGIRTYRAPDAQIRWEAAAWFADAPAASAVRGSFSSLASTADFLCKKLGKDLADEELEFAYSTLEATACSVELAFVGNPYPNMRWIVCCTNQHGAGVDFPIEQQAKLAERMRRLIEGRFGGWIDGVFSLHTFQRRDAKLVLKEGSATVASGTEKDILAWLESRDGDDIRNRSVFPARVGANPLALYIVPPNESGRRLEDAHLDKLWTRYKSFIRKNNELVSSLTGERIAEEQEDRFIPPSFHVSVATTTIARLGLTLPEVASRLSIDKTLLQKYFDQSVLPVRFIPPLANMLGLESANALYAEPDTMPRSKLDDPKSVALVLTRFEHVEVETDPRYSTSSVVRLEKVLDELCADDLAGRRKEHAVQPSERLNALFAQAIDAKLVFLMRPTRQFVRDLPLGRERLAMVGALSLVEESLVRIGESKQETSDAEAPAWSERDDKMLSRLNAVTITAKELLDVGQEHSRMVDAGNERDWETTMFATVRVFKGQPDRAHAAHTRMQALSRLMATENFSGWSEAAPSGDGMMMVSRPMFEASARCLLEQIDNEIGFDTNRFRLIMIDHVDAAHSN